MNPDQVSPDPDPGKRALQELAAEVLSKEQATPGSQDPEMVRWATDKLNGGGQTAPPSSAPVSVPPQLPQPVATATNQGDETVLQIQQTPGQTIRPTEGGNKPDNGQGGTSMIHPSTPPNKEELGEQ